MYMRQILYYSSPFVPFSISPQTYGETSDASYIELKKQCLYYTTHLSAKRIKEIAVDVKISKAAGDRTVTAGRRRSNTTVVVRILIFTSAWKNVTQ